MNSFETMGNAILLANEGQRQVAHFVVGWIARLASTVRKVLSAKQPTSIHRA